MRLIKVASKKRVVALCGGRLAGPPGRAIAALHETGSWAHQARFENVAGSVVKAVSPAAGDNVYWKFVMPPGISWGVVVPARRHGGSTGFVAPEPDLQVAAGL